MDIQDLRNSRNSATSILTAEGEKNDSPYIQDTEEGRILCYVKECARLRLPINAVISGLPFEEKVLTKSRKISKEELDAIVYNNTGFSLREYYEGYASTSLKKDLLYSRVGYIEKKEIHGRAWEMAMVIEPAVIIDDEQEQLRKANRQEIARMEKEAHDTLEESIGKKISLHKLNEHFS